MGLSVTRPSGSAGQTSLFDELPDTNQVRPSEGARELLQHPDLWRADQLSSLGQALSALPTGFACLDDHLPGGGWPRAGLGEFLLNTLGLGELRLLAPLLARLSREEARWVGWVNPPFVPYAPALEALDIDVAKMLLIHPKNHKDALWALEQASKSGSCSVVMAWLDERKVKLKDTRRLQLAAKQGQTFVCLFRPVQAAQQNSLAELRLQITAAGAGELEIAINKRRRGWPVQGLRVRLCEDLEPAAVTEQLGLWRSFRQRQQAAKGRAEEREMPTAVMARTPPPRSASPLTH